MPGMKGQTSEIVLFLLGGVALCVFLVKLGAYLAH